MNNRYYAPKLEEFHIGFEYEELCKNGWRCQTLNVNETEYPDLGELMNLKELLITGKLRVKYLDKEDIESILKTKQLKGDEVELNFQKIIDDYSFYEFDYDVEEKVLTIELFSQTKLVARSTGQSDCFTKFNGIIKNKSELAKLLKQLQIE